MKFTDSGPIIAIASLLFDIVRAFLPSWFPKVYPAEHDLGQVCAALDTLSEETQEIHNEITMTRNVLRVPEPVPQESIAEILISVRNELQTSTAAFREQTEVLRHLRTDLQAIATREDVDLIVEPMIASLVKVQDALSKLPEPVSAFPEDLGQGMHGQSSGSQECPLM
ncbi:hypothetical protein MMYC01_201613 [Madurella mycetomatis]|uniref:Uncharacterized protein n=1 Tax=Madurella mycetomatis TaxID=100816 RepID=A0A175WC17_9PEZI|nr:hypothetical protein MMYC01_201613 [Madurella mycetomatis]